MKPATLLKTKLWHSCYVVNFEKYLRTPFLQTTSGRLFLHLTALLIIVSKLSILDVCGGSGYTSGNSVT